MKNAVTLLVLFLAFTGCSSNQDPAPAAGVITINLLNTTSWPGVPATASLCETPRRAPGTGKVLWTNKMTNAKVVYGSVARGTRLYLSIQFDDVSVLNYWLPARGESMQVEVMVDGKRAKGVLLNADSATDPANYFLTDASQTHLVQEVEVVI